MTKTQGNGLLLGILGALIGVGMGVALYQLQIMSLWLVLIPLTLLLALWQTPCIRVALSATDLPKRSGEQQKRGKCVRGWLLRVAVYLVLVGIMMVGWSYWEVHQEITMADYVEKDKEATKAKLPTSYALKQISWELGATEYPKMVSIPTGSFQMGSDENDDEKPIHEVKIQKRFEMSAHEITFEQYDYYVWSMAKTAKKLTVDQSNQPKYAFDEAWGRENRPVINVNWDDAQGYSEWLGKEIGQSCRLPSEAEWEYAARAGSTTHYAWGDEVGENNANCNGCGSEWDGKQTAPVESFKPNAFGLYDMHGNVWEWVQDCYVGNYTEASNLGLATEQAKCSSRVLRGGSWGNGTDDVRSAIRSGNRPVVRGYNLGFRVVCGLPSAER